MLKVMTESKETREGETLSCSHGKNMKYRGCDSSHAPIVEGTDDVEIDIHGANECRPNSPALEELIVHSDSDIFGTLMLKSKCLRVENHGKPISRKDGKEKECLKVMVEFPLGVSNRVIIEQQKWFSIDCIRVLLMMIGEGMMGPVLTHPIPLTPSNHICSKSKEIVDPCLFGCCPMVCIMLDI